MYYEELPRDYPAWLAKKMEPQVNTILSKGTEQKRPRDDGSESE